MVRSLGEVVQFGGIVLDIEKLGGLLALEIVHDEFPPVGSDAALGVFER